MKTRMQKYYDEGSNTLLREQRNLHLYDNMDNLEDIDYKIENNATILQDNAKNIDVEHIKKILDNKYNQTPRRRSIVVDEDYAEEEENISLEETREYDINTILEKAREEKEVNYDKERLKKLRDTQFDILTSLDVEDNKEVSRPQENNELMDLINTITARELVSKEQIKEKTEDNDVDPLDILTELKGNDDTVVVGAAYESESISETSPIMTLEQADQIKPLIMEDERKNQELTSTLQFTQSDFDDFNDLKKEVKSSKALIYAVIVIVSLIFIAGLVIFLNKFLNLNWF